MNKDDNPKAKDNKQHIFDIVIIGAGAAGLSAAIYAKRSNKDIALVEADMAGGQLLWTTVIENYPGFPKGIDGQELASRMKDQAQELGVKITADKVSALKRSSSNNIFTLKGDKDTYLARAVIVATGASPKKLGLPNEARFIGKGISFCATCDAPLFKGKEVAVIGGGNAALEEALYLCDFASKVYVIHRRDEFRGVASLEDRVRAHEKIDIILSHVPLDFEGDNMLSGVVLKDVNTDKTKVLKVSGVFIFIGSKPNSECVRDIVDTDEGGFIITDEAMMSACEGVFAAGDVRKKEHRQVILSAAEGSLAAISANRYTGEHKVEL